MSKDQSSKAVHPHWRPNFCNSAKLPDIKVIRTNFLVNFVAVTLALIFGFFGLQREYRAYSLGNEIEIMQERVASAEAQDKLKLKQSEQFRSATASIIDLEKFFSSPILAHDFLVGLSAIRPKDFIIDSINFSESSHAKGKKRAIGYKLTLAGEVQDPLVLEKFKKTLQEAGFLTHEALDTYVDESLRGRDATTGAFPYSIVVSLIPKGFTK